MHLLHSNLHTNSIHQNKQDVHTHALERHLFKLNHYDENIIRRTYKLESNGTLRAELQVDLAVHGWRKAFI